MVLGLNLKCIKGMKEITPLLLQIRENKTKKIYHFQYQSRALTICVGFTLCLKSWRPTHQLNIPKVCHCSQNIKYMQKSQALTHTKQSERNEPLYAKCLFLLYLPVSAAPPWISHLPADQSIRAMQIPVSILHTYRMSPSFCLCPKVQQCYAQHHENIF